MTRFNEMYFGQKWALWNGSIIAIAAGRMLRAIVHTAQYRQMNVITAQNKVMSVITAMNRSIKVFMTGG